MLPFSNKMASAQDAGRQWPRTGGDGTVAMPLRGVCVQPRFASAHALRYEGSHNLAAKPNRICIAIEEKLPWP
jgi:hypothetical protein